jgi:hypothetical protein
MRRLRTRWSQGFHLKRITELSRVDYIWLKFDTHKIEIWSFAERYLPKAARMLKKRINALMPEDAAVEVGEGNVVIQMWREYPKNVSYTIAGDESGCLKAFEGILKEYPFNPYFTKMKSKVTSVDGVTTIKVTRADSSD